MSTKAAKEIFFKKAYTTWYANTLLVALALGASPSGRADTRSLDAGAASAARAEPSRVPERLPGIDER